MSSPCFKLSPEARQMLVQRSLLVVDLECTCMLDRPDESEVREVIEIGFAHVRWLAPSGSADGESHRVEPGTSWYVRPQSTPVTPGCTKLTGITPQRVANAPSFAQRMVELGDLLAQTGATAWASWGEFDASMFKLQCEREGVANTMAGLPHLNAKKLLSPWIANQAKTSVKQRHGGYGLGLALKALAMDFVGRQHSGADDAFNAARLIARAGLAAQEAAPGSMPS